MEKHMESINILSQRFLCVDIVRKNDHLLVIELLYQDTEREDRLSLEVEIGNFQIQSVFLETPRSPKGSGKKISLPFMNGKIIYLNKGGELKNAITSWGETSPCILTFSAPSVNIVSEAGEMYTSLPEREHIARLFLELISNIVQAEMFIWKERGFNTLKEYRQYFERMYGASCIRYSQPENIDDDNYFLKGQKRKYSLFTRMRSVVIGNEEQQKGNEKKHFIISHLCDSIHEITLLLKTLSNENTTFILEEIKGNFIRCPYEACPGAANRLSELVGISLTPENRKKIISVLTGPTGCSHMSDLVSDTIQALHRVQ